MRVARAFLAALTCCWLLGCKETAPAVVFAPSKGPHAQVYYRNGQPLAALEGDSSSAVINVTPFRLDGTNYLRVFVAYFNSGTQPVLVNPVSAVRARYKLLSWDDWSIAVPDAPTTILRKVESMKARAEIAAVLGAALNRTANDLTTQSTSISGPTGTYTMNDRPDKLRERNQETDKEWAAQSGAASRTFDMLAVSINEGVLRANTVFPGQGVEGYVYLPVALARGRWVHDMNGTFFVPDGPRGSLSECECLVDLALPGLARSTSFTPIPEE